MNRPLIQALQDGDITQALQLIEDTSILKDATLKGILTDDELNNSVQTTVVILMESLATFGNEKPDLATLFNKAVAQSGLQDIQDNPVTPQFVRMMMIVLAAILS